MRNRILWVNAVIFLCVFNYMILQKEDLIASGKQVYLELIPVDPRSLLQGDYMDLSYQIANDVSFNSKDSEDGYIIAKVDSNHVATFSRFGLSLEAVGPDEVKIKFRRRGTSVRIASDAFFFQNGQSEKYSDARYGFVKVGEDGEVLLVGLAKMPGEML